MNAGRWQNSPLGRFSAQARHITPEDTEAKNAFLQTVPQRRAGDPKEIAGAITFVTSDKASFLTGQTIAIDGGVTAT
jgi:NAD(P)-dependent dehydrogenase (short-subunit alcohol dehydrogenase family)